MFKNQLEAIAKLKKMRVGALFMKMGTGKTRVAIELVNNTDCDLLLYFCPFSCKINIDNELMKWGLNKQYKVVGYETIQSSDREYLKLLEDIDNKKVFIIADESIFLKNNETKRFNRLLTIRQKCQFALLLNGTPITKNEWDLYNQMYFLSPLIINMTRLEFQSTFFTKIECKKKNEKPKTFYKFSNINADVLKKMIEPYIFECDLSFEKHEAKTYVFFEYSDNDYIEEKLRRLEEYQKTLNSDEILQMLTNLNKICSCNNREKTKAIQDYCKDRKVIIYCNFIKEVESISNGLDCFVITGKTKNREFILKQFETSNKPLVLTFGVGSFSLNLQHCNEIVYSSLNFDYGRVEQSEYRIKRTGQEQNIKYSYFLSDTGITKMILDNLDKKQSLADIIKIKIMNGDVEKWLKNI